MDRTQALHALGLTEPCTRDDAEATYRQRIAFLQPHLRDPAARDSALKLEAQYEKAWRTLSVAAMPSEALQADLARPAQDDPLPSPPVHAEPSEVASGPTRRTIQRLIVGLLVVVIAFGVVSAYQKLQPGSARNTCVNERNDGDLITVACSSKKADFKVRRQVDRPSECNGPDYMEKKTLYVFKQTYCLTPIKR